VDVNQNQDHCLSKGDIYKEEFVVGKGGGVKNVFVWLQDANNPKAKLPIHSSLKEVKEKEVVIDQPCCKFEPHALALRAGQVLIGKNSAPVSHNMHWLGGDDNPGDNKVIPAGAKIEIELNASTKPVQITCDIHRWMKAWVRVFDHPYFAVTDADGKFEIKNAPAGKFRLMAWQEEQGWVAGDDGKPNGKGQLIEIKPGETTDVKLEVKP
jgi:plastocyanin